MPKKLTPEQLSELREMAQDNISRADIARALGISPASVTRVLGASRAYRGKRANLPGGGEITQEASDANVQ